MLKHLAHSITLALIAISLSGCMFSDQDASAFQEMMSIWDTPQTSDKDNCTPTSSKPCSDSQTNSGNQNSNENSGTGNSDSHTLTPVDSGLTDSLIRNYCQYYGTNPTFEQTTCYKQIIQYAIDYPLCVDQEDAYYDCANNLTKYHISSRHPADLYYFQSICEEEELPSHLTLDDCISNQIVDLLNLPAWSNYGFSCENEQQDYDTCMNSQYQVIPELFYRR